MMGKLSLSKRVQVQKESPTSVAPSTRCPHFLMNSATLFLKTQAEFTRHSSAKFFVKGKILCYEKDWT